MSTLPKLQHLSNPRPEKSLQDVLALGVSPGVIIELLKNVSIFLARQNRELAAQLKLSERRLLLSRQALLLLDEKRRGVLQP